MGSRDFFRRRLLAPVYDTLAPAELCARARAGDPEAFVALVRSRYGLVAAVVRRRLRPGEPVEDLVLDVFAELWRQRAELADPAAIDGWLTRTADRLAGRWTATAIRERDWRPLTPDARDPSDEAMVAELGERVRRAVAELSAGDQRVIAAAGAFESDAAAAGALGVPVGRYRVRLHRARERLRAVLGRYGFGPLVGLLGWIGGALGRVWRTKLGKLLGLAAAGGLAAGGVLLRVPATPPPVRPPTADRPPESLPAKNLRLFEADVRPRLQAALDGMAAGDGGRAVLTADAQGTRVWVSAELRHGPPQRHVTRLELMYDTWDDSYRFFEDTLGYYRTLNVRDPLAVARTRFGLPDLTRPTTGLRDALAALRQLPQDSRAPAGRKVEVKTLRAVLGRHVGGWGDGRAVEWATGREHRDGGAVAFRGGPVRFCYWQDLWLRADGAVVGYHSDVRGPFVLSADGRRIEWGGGPVWVRHTPNGSE